LTAACLCHDNPIVEYEECRTFPNLIGESSALTADTKASKTLAESTTALHKNCSVSIQQQCKLHECTLQ